MKNITHWNMALAVATLLGVGPVSAAQQGTLDGEVYTFTLADGAQLTLNADDIIALGTGNKLLVQKADGATGTGRLEITTNLKEAGWDGEIEVTGGNLRVSTTGSLGGTAKGTFIRSGGQLQLNVSTNYCFDAETFEFCGEGSDKRGALVHETTSSLQHLISDSKQTGKATITLTGDTTFTILSGSDIRYYSRFDMGGHTLRLKGKNLNFVATPIWNAADIFVESANFGFESTSYISKTSANQNDATDMTVYFVSSSQSEQTFRFCNTATFVPSIVTSNALKIIHGWGLATQTIKGDVTLNGMLTIDYQDSDATTRYALNFDGTVTANGNAFACYKDTDVTFTKKIETPVFDRYYISKGHVSFADLGEAYFTSGNSFIGSTDYSAGKMPARLDLTGSFTLTNVDCAINLGYASINGSSDAQRGILTVGDGVYMTNRLNVGSGAWDKRKITGALYQRGGVLHDKTASGMIGSYCDGYYEMTGGYLWPGQWFHVGHKGGRGVFVQKGGYVDAYSSDGLSIAGGSDGDDGARGHIYLSGGVMTHAGGMMICKTLWTNADARKALGILTVDGTASFEGNLAYDVVQSYIRMAYMSNSVAIVNLNGGYCRVAGFMKVYDAAKEYGSNWGSSYGKPLYDDNRAYVNFNGGTVEKRCGTATPYLFKKTADCNEERVTRVTIYKGGARLIADKYDYSLGAPLRKPTGKGILSVPFSCDTAWQYVGSPMVEIEGDGTGASAFAEFDSTSGKITGVKVLSPGNDYTWAKALIGYGGWSNRTEIVLTPEDNETGGGVTLCGTKQVTFDCVNDYEGATRVEGTATIKAGVAGAIPSGSALELFGGTIDLNGFAHTASYLTGTNGTVKGNLAVTDRLATDAALRRDGLGGPLAVQGTLTFGAGAKIVLDHSEEIGEHSAKYVIATATDGIVGTPTIVVNGDNASAFVRLDGNSIVAGSRKGFLILVH